MPKVQRTQEAGPAAEDGPATSEVRSAQAQLLAERIVEHVTDLPRHAAVAVPEAVERLRATIDPRASYLTEHLRGETLTELPELSDEDNAERDLSVASLQEAAARR